jgi:uroporphyrinogen-III decarboxylase
MRNTSWDDLISLIEGRRLDYQPVGFIIDSPWIPGWYGISTVDFYSSDKLWFDSNLKAANTFPQVWFMPGFWSEYGMCTEPSAFGSRMIFHEDTLPYAQKIITDVSDYERLPVPNVRTDGLLPFVIGRLRRSESEIIDAGHQVRFAVSRGPLNIASFLMGTTEFMMALAIDPDNSHRLIGKITDFVCDWISWQKECFPSIDGILILDDLIGFLGEPEFTEFVVPYFKKIFASYTVKVRFLHNDADGVVTAKKLEEVGVNMFNFSFNHTMGEMRELTGPGVILVGNIPPRDILSAGTAEDVRGAVKKAFGEVTSYERIIWSAGGGMPPGVTDSNINAFVEAVRENQVQLPRSGF